MMQLAAIPRSPSLVDQVCRQLAGLLRDAQAEGDQWLPTERHLSAKLGVSRSVVREATKRLEMQGLVEVHHGIGIKAVNHLHKPLSSAVELLVPEEDERLRQLVEIRLCMEPQNARLAAHRSEKARLKLLSDTHRQLVEAADIEAAVRADMDFHCNIAVASGNHISTLLMLALCDLLRASLVRGYSRVTTDSAILEHGRILQAITQGDGDGAAKAMAKHIHTTQDELSLKPARKKRK
jgi:GntR family transcriptional repressor for pyruvate dehydrogenase complex